jgi:hypothetical protein
MLTGVYEHACMQRAIYKKHCVRKNKTKEVII